MNMADSLVKGVQSSVCDQTKGSIKNLFSETNDKLKQVHTLTKSAISELKEGQKK
jgi:hypothetical protein